MRNNLREQILIDLKTIKNKGKGFKELDSKYFKAFYDKDKCYYFFYQLLFLQNIKDDILKVFFNTTDTGLFMFREEIIDIIEDYLLNEELAS